MFKINQYFKFENVHQILIIWGLKTFYITAKLPVGRSDGAVVGEAVGLGEGPREGKTLGDAIAKTKPN